VLPLAESQLIFGVRMRIDNQDRVAFGVSRQRLRRHSRHDDPAFQGQIVRHAEQPTAQAVPGFSAGEVSVESQKYVLYNLFGVRDGKAKTERVPQDPAAHLIE
jgi:hypothetical protein